MPSGKGFNVNSQRLGSTGVIRWHCQFRILSPTRSRKLSATGHGPLSRHLPLLHPCDRDVTAPQSKYHKARHPIDRSSLRWSLDTESWCWSPDEWWIHSIHLTGGSPIYFRPKSAWFAAAKSLASSGHAIIQWIGLRENYGTFTGNPPYWMVKTMVSG